MQGFGLRIGYRGSVFVVGAFVGLIGGLFSAAVGALFGGGLARVLGASGLLLNSAGLISAFLGALVLGAKSWRNSQRDPELIPSFRHGAGKAGTLIGFVCGVFAALVGLLYFAGALP